MDISSIRFGAQIASAAAAHHLDPALLAAVAAQETGGPGVSSGNNVVGDGGHGHGVFQIDDRSWAFAKSGAAMDPAKNANFAAGILADNLQRYGGNVHAALAAYNSGSPNATGTATTWGDGTTLGYADSVLRHYAELAGSSAATAAQLTADGPQNSASVNALANAYGAAPPAATSPFATGSPISPLAGSSATSSPYGSANSWNALSSTSQQLGASTVSTMAQMIDEGDVFDNGGGDDES